MPWAKLEEQFSFATDLLLLYLFSPSPSHLVLTASSLGAGQTLDRGLHRIWCKKNSDLEVFL